MSEALNGFTVWLTGMNGAGKSTLAKYLAGRFQALGKPVEVLESNEVSELFAKGLGDSKDDRNLLVKRLGFAARGITKAHGVAIVPALSPYRDAREQLRREIGRFVEIFVDCPVEVLIARDTTGRYKKAMTGEIPNFVGITDPYEPPQNPEVTIRTDAEAVHDAAERIFQSLLDLGFLRGEDVLLLAGKSMRRGKAGKKAKNTVRPATIKTGILKPVAKAAPTKVEAKSAPAAEAKPAPKAKAEAKPKAKSEPKPKIVPKKKSEPQKKVKPSSKSKPKKSASGKKSRPEARAAKTATKKKSK